MKKSHRKALIYLAATTVLVALLIGIQLWSVHLGHEFTNKYGGREPAIGTDGMRTNPLRPDEVCVEIRDVIPNAHYNWFGHMWQDEYILWEDVSWALNNTAVEHGRTGPMKVGEDICWPKGKFLSLTYRPDGTTLINYLGVSA
jgi:hypothetical protein